VTSWRDVVDRAALAVGPISPTLLRHWHNEMDDVEHRVTDLDPSWVEGRGPAEPHGLSTARGADGLHALVALAVARLGDMWQPRQLVDVAAAVELAYRASHQHRRVVNGLGPHASPASGVRPNTKAVLEGDRSITQAAVLVADVGPAAYRVLVRGYGATQVGQLCDAPAPTALIDAAVGLGALVAGVSAADIDQLWREVDLPADRRSTSAAVLAWARAEVLAAVSSPPAGSPSEEFRGNFPPNLPRNSSLGADRRPVRVEVDDDETGRWQALT